MSAVKNVPNDPIVHFSHGPGYVAPAAASTYAAPASEQTYIAPAGAGASEMAVHGLGVGVDAQA